MRMKRAFLGGLMLSLFLAGCAMTDPPALGEVAPPPFGWDAALRMPELIDESPDPAIVEGRLTAQQSEMEIIAGTTTPVLAYNGSVPGPLIRAKVGDRLLVHFHNALPSPSSLHWHGVRVPNAMDGVPDHTQPGVAQGQDFDYVFDLIDAGLFWYHPHSLSASSEQVGSGLYGALLVEDPAEPKELGDEIVLVLSDIGVDEDGALRPTWVGGDISTLFGREGMPLVNGRVNPVLEVTPGRRMRWRIVNAARSRYFQIALAGHTFVRIGGDGGFIAQAQPVETVVLTPGERADVLVTPQGEPGSELPARWVPYERGFGSTDFRDEVVLFRLHFSDRTGGSVSPAPPNTDAAIAALDLSNAVTRQIDLTQKEGSDRLELGINGVPVWRAAPIHARIGETQVWAVRNTMRWSHPFHLHGYFFQVLDINGVPPATREWKDTVDVPVDATTRVAIHFDDRPGMWMFHCHILDHADVGMMGMVHVQP
jgi:FtsP/CotA-like multicopper oxidase with cupredoxin domain